LVVQVPASTTYLARVKSLLPGTGVRDRFRGHGLKAPPPLLFFDLPNDRG
jgi:hypothetical protein